MVAGPILWFQAGISWFFMVLGRFFMGTHGSRSFFMVPGWYFMVFHGFRSVFHGFSWVQVGFHGFHGSRLVFLQNVPGILARRSSLGPPPTGWHRT